MNNFWIAVVISVIAGMVYIWFSVRQTYLSYGLDGSDEGSKQNNIFTLIPIMLLLIAPIGYFYLGNADKQISWQSAIEKMGQIQEGDRSSVSQSDIQDLVLSLRTSIANEPQNGQLWFMLAESYFQLRMVDLADAAMQKALRIEARPDWFVANAQILSMRSSESDISKSINLLQNALSIQPEHQSALLTLGFVYFRKQQFEFAIGAWQKLLIQLEASGSNTSSIQRQIDFAKHQLALRERQNSD